MSRAIDPSTWEPPEPPAVRGDGRIRGTLYGSKLYEQPKHAAFASSVRSFCVPGPPLSLEIGVDRGYRILGHARRWPQQRWFGVELRRSILDAAEQTPDNCLLLRGDVRAVLAAGLIPMGRLQRVDILFPTPSNAPGHLLLTPEVVDLLAQHLAADGVLLFATDVPGMARLAERLLASWPRVDEPPSGPVRSRREKVCARNDLPVWRWACTPP
ncbi:MAG: tRNA (guanine-N7-)-methyltransferase, partial [Myxococcota bacterium]